MELVERFKVGKFLEVAEFNQENESKRFNKLKNKKKLIDIFIIALCPKRILIIKIS